MLGSINILCPDDVDQYMSDKSCMIEKEPRMKLMASRQQYTPLSLCMERRRRQAVAAQASMAC
jgi:hypothetical protein